MKTKFGFLMISLALVLALAAPALSQEGEPLLLTLAELKAFDGKDGRPAYVAVDGVIYDMSQSRPWANGGHNGFTAGNDLTKEIKEISPHGVAMLERVPAVGRLAVELTLEELAAFNGQDGKPAYVAVDGVIYEVTASKAWANGGHNGFTAGSDLTREIKEVSPHGVIKLENVVKVGYLVIKLNLEQLREFDGKDGKPAYFAVNGVIYDATGNASWTDGAHKGSAAGNDLSADFAASPHEPSTLEKLPRVGILIP